VTPQGVELVPGIQKSQTVAPTEEDADDPVEASPVMIGLEPSVVSIPVGTETSLSLVARGAPASGYRIPVTVSFDPTRIAINSMSTVEGVSVSSQSLEPEEGWLELDFDVAPGELSTTHGLAVLRVRALSTGPVPLVVTAGRATADDGTTLPVAVGNGAVFVTDEPSAVGR